jgi:hypothetical protein
MAHHGSFTSATRRIVPASRRFLPGLVAAVALAAMAGMPAQAAGDQPDGQDHASLTQSTLALNRDLAREYARGEQLLRTPSGQENASRWRTSARIKPRNQAALYPTGEDGVMLEMNFQY